MIDARVFTDVAPGATAENIRLRLLLDAVAIGDRAAFRSLYGMHAMRVWRHAIRLVPCPTDARAVTRSTFVEVWNLAGCDAGRAGPDVRGWIAEITARRAHDRQRVGRPPGALLIEYDEHVHRELTALLGAGRG